MDLRNLSVQQLVDAIKNRQVTCVEVTQYYLSQIERWRHKNAVLEVFDDAISRAEAMDKKIETEKDLPPLIGVPILIKDNIMYKGHIASSASKMLENYTAQYSSTVVEKLLDAGVVILGRTNMDEFAMGGSCEKSAFGPCKNAYDDSRVSGGSSGGSAVAVALDMCAFALGSDTGGSVRQPASYNGVVGIKPTYARVSRYGLMAFASSLDTIGVFTRNVKDNAFVLSIIAGKDEKDATSSSVEVEDYSSCISGNIEGKKIAVIKEVQALVEKTEYASIYREVLSYCQKHGAIVTEVSLPEYDAVLSAYYTIVFAEGSSNMARFDGVRFGKREESDSQDKMYKLSRSKNLGREVKRRIMMGSFVLSSAHYNSYYVKAKNIAKKLKGEISQILNDNDVIFMPTTYGEAFAIGSKMNDPVSMYIEDIFTVTANIVGVPAISVPAGRGKTGLPIGLQILSKHFGESELYNIADFVMERGRA